MLYRVVMMDGKTLIASFNTNRLFRALRIRRIWRKTHPDFQVDIVRGSYYDNT